MQFNIIIIDDDDDDDVKYRKHDKVVDYLDVTVKSGDVCLLYKISEATTDKTILI